MKKVYHITLKRFFIAIGVGYLCFLSASLRADNSIAHVIQMRTQFEKVYGKPTWLLILRNVETQKVFPYVFDIQNNNNYWIALTDGRFYRIIVSQLTFGRYARISNFCHLENRMVSDMSMNITLNGVLSPDPFSSRCYVTRYQDMPFTVAHTPQP